MTDLVDRLRDIAHYIEVDVVGGSGPAKTVREAIGELEYLYCKLERIRQISGTEP